MSNVSTFSTVEALSSKTCIKRARFRCDYRIVDLDSIENWQLKIFNLQFTQCSRRSEAERRWRQTVDMKDRPFGAHFL